MGGATETAFLAVAGAVVIWDVVVAGHAGRAPGRAEWFRWITAFAALLLVPAAVVAVADSSLTTARITSGIAWLWPLTLALAAVQAGGAMVARLVSPAIAIPLVAWNVTLALVAAGRLYADAGTTAPLWLATLGAAEMQALGRVTGDGALTSPVAILPPLMAPVYRTPWRGGVAVRAAVALLAAVGVAAIAREIRSAAAAIHSYDRFATQSLQERPRGDFAIGVRILPTVREAPAPYALRMDLGVVDSIGARAVLVVVDPRAHGPAMDSLGRVLDTYRRDSVVVIVAVGNAPRAVRTSADDRDALRERLAFVDQVARRLHPQYLLPEPPDGDNGGRSIETREELLARTAVVAHAVNARIRVGASLRPGIAADSALYAWATPSDSPVDAIGFAIAPGFAGASTIDAQLAIAARWMRAATGAPREHWVWAATTAPVVHGELSQRRALHGLLAWATSHATVNGLIVSSAGDYDAATGLRATSGRLRPAVEMLTRAIDALSDTRAPPAPAAIVAPAPGPVPAR